MKYSPDEYDETTELWDKIRELEEKIEFLVSKYWEDRILGEQK